MSAIRASNLGLRFLLELCALAAFGYWGFRVGPGILAKLVLGLGAPMLMAVVWGLFIAPKATIQVPLAVWVILQVIIFGLAAAGLAAAGQPRLAAIFLALVAINSALLALWRS